MCLTVEVVHHSNFQKTLILNIGVIASCFYYIETNRLRPTLIVCLAFDNFGQSFNALTLGLLPVNVIRHLFFLNFGDFQHFFTK